MACVKADRAWALGQVRAGRIPSAISRLLQLHARESRMSWSVAAQQFRGGHQQLSLVGDDVANSVGQAAIGK
jgi:hypothetical protein